MVKRSLVLLILAGIFIIGCVKEAVNIGEFIKEETMEKQSKEKINDNIITPIIENETIITSILDEWKACNDYTDFVLNFMSFSVC